ncbi:MAG: hypothetical protein Q9179_000729 [Wetmoreana sp. 5 TL-2023]
MTGPQKEPKRLNVLVLDGGGVRGLSSLLILQALMARINQIVGELLGTSSDLQPHHIFQLVAGTSTGGLIALMLGKMGMTIEECITKYEQLSKKIFGKKHMRGRVTRGLAPAKYSGKRLQKCIRDLLRERQLDEDLSMSHKPDRVAWYVHCLRTVHLSSKAFSPHGDLDCSRVRFTNIGTGVKQDEVEPGKRDWLLSHLPGAIRNGVFLKQTLTEIATNSENIADMMRKFEELNPELIMYERFDANHRVSNIRLDDYNALGEIKTKTERYLAEQETSRIRRNKWAAKSSSDRNPNGKNRLTNDLEKVELAVHEVKE